MWDLPSGTRPVHFGGSYNKGVRPMISDSYSQYGQDRFLIDEIFKGARAGTFVEIGALDGVTYSNTALLERRYDWTGVCMEPLPTAFEQLKGARRCVCVQAAAAAQPGKLLFGANAGHGAALSGRIDTCPPLHAERIDRESSKYGFERQTIEVDAVRAADVLRENGMTTVDYVSIDVEGGELEALKGLLDDDITVRVISAENNYGTDEVRRFLEARGYLRITSVGDDDIYRLKSECTLADRWRAVRNLPFQWRRTLKWRIRAARSSKA